mgnify:CR=1 FL=1
MKQRHAAARPGALHRAAHASRSASARSRPSGSSSTSAARAVVPDLPGVKDVPFLTNSTMMDVDFLPEHLVIVGGSYIGLEFAQMYRRFGSKVTVVERMAKLLPREDDDVAAEIRAILEREGVAIRTGAECMALKKKGERIEIGLECKDGEPIAEGSHVLLAVGRTPNTDDLESESSGHRNGRARLRHGRRRVPHQRRGRLGARARQTARARSPTPRTTTTRSSPPTCSTTTGGASRTGSMTYALFIDPPLGRAGMNEAGSAARADARCCAPRCPWRASAARAKRARRRDS